MARSGSKELIRIRFQASWTWAKRELDEDDELTAGHRFRGFVMLFDPLREIVMCKEACVAFLFVLFLATESMAQDWPPLPKQGFISGRVATRADVAAGNAVFSAAFGGGAVGKSTPLQIQIPQYAYYNEGGTKTPVIVLQAERADIQKQGGEVVQITSVGALKPDGRRIVGLLMDFELLGLVPPR